MSRSLRTTLLCLSLAGLVMPTPARGQNQSSTKPSLPLPSVRRVRVVGTGVAIGIEIETSERLTPQTQVLTGPDRLVMDFPNALPGNELRNQVVNRGEIKDFRVSIFSANPPVTRVVVDLKSAQSYKVFASGRTLLVKLGADADEAEADDREVSFAGPLVRSNFKSAQPLVPVQPPAPARPALKVSFDDGLLSIASNKATLSEILYAVHQRTGADIAVPAGAELEKVVVDLGPAPAPEVLADLLNGSKFNFLILSSANDPRSLDRVVLSPRGEMVQGPRMPVAAPPEPVAPLVRPAPPTPEASDAEAEGDPPARAEAHAETTPPAKPEGDPQATGAPPEVKPPQNDPPD